MLNPSRSPHHWLAAHYGVLGSCRLAASRPYQTHLTRLKRGSRRGLAQVVRSAHQTPTAVSEVAVLVMVAE